MSFSGPLDQITAKRVKNCNDLLAEPARLAALERTHLFATPQEPSFDRLASLAATVLKVPLTLISLLNEKTQFLKAAFGLPALDNASRLMPIEDSICRFTLNGEHIVADNAQSDPLLQHHPLTGKWGVAACIAIPLVTEEGHVLGAFCVLDTKARSWTAEDVQVMRELAALVMTEVRLHEKVLELEVQRELREQFVAQLTRDLRTPLHVAKMGVEVLKGRPSVDERSQVLRLIDDNIERTDHMIQDLLNAALLNAGQRLRFNFTDCSLNDIVETSLRAITALHGRRFLVHFDQDITGVWDEHAIQRIIVNLVSNAVKYGAADKPITLRIQREESVDVCIQVHNEGQPLSNEELNELMGSFRRLRNVDAKSQGWGLGLSLVRGFAEGHGGTLKAQSSNTEGTTFTVTLPINSRR